MIAYAIMVLPLLFVAVGDYIATEKCSRTFIGAWYLLIVVSLVTQALVLAAISYFIT